MVRESKLKKLTENKINKIWLNNSQIIKYNFGLRLYQYAQGKVFDYSCFKYSNILPKDHSQRSMIIKQLRSNRRSSTVAVQFQSLLLGYNAIYVNLTPYKCNLSSEQANKNKSKCTQDHVIGVTSVAQYVIKIFREDFLKIEEHKNWNIYDNSKIQNKIGEMCDKWLKDNLWLWSQCRITKDEHKIGNLARGGEFSVQEKANLKHYEEAGIKIEQYE